MRERPHRDITTLLYLIGKLTSGFDLTTIKCLKKLRKEFSLKVLEILHYKRVLTDLSILMMK